MLMWFDSFKVDKMVEDSHALPQFKPMEIKYSYVDLLDSIDQHVRSLMLNKSFIKMLGIYLCKEGRVCAVTKKTH